MRCAAASPRLDFKLAARTWIQGRGARTRSDTCRVASACLREAPAAANFAQDVAWQRRLLARGPLARERENTPGDALQRLAAGLGSRSEATSLRSVLRAHGYAARVDFAGSPVAARWRRATSETGSPKSPQGNASLTLQSFHEVLALEPGLTTPRESFQPTDGGRRPASHS